MAGPLFADRVCESSTTTGTGTYSLAGAVTGYQGFVAGIGDNNTCWYCAMDVDGNGVPSGGWEVGIGTVDDASPDTLTRDKIIASSNANAAVSWAAGTRRIFVTSPAAHALPSLDAGGRLTLESGVPVSTTDQTAKTSVFYTPYRHNRIALWNGSGWEVITFAETTLALGTLTSGKNYDVWGRLSSGVLALDFSAAWTTDIARADAVTTQDAITVKSGDVTRRLLGTIRTTSTTTTEDSLVKRFVWSAHNQTPRDVRRFDGTDSWTYATSTYHQANANADNQVEVVVGAVGMPISISLVAIAAPATLAPTAAIGVDSLSNPHLASLGRYANFGGTGPIVTSFASTVPLGYHVYAWLEAVIGASTCSFFGDAGLVGMQSGMVGQVWN